MATNKNQHFVPRCYLRAFTTDEGNTTIKLFNLNGQRFISNAPVKNQCSSSYFYGEEPELEHAIQSTESAYAGTLRRVREPGYVFDTNDASFLRFFWLVQYLRTEAASTRTVEMAQQANEAVGGTVLPLEFGIRDAVMAAMDAVWPVSPSIEDLKVCLLRNKTAVPFITSDDPAVATNRWYLEDKRAIGMSFGLRSSGFVALLPLTPKIMFLAYDGDVYSVQHEQGWATVRSEGDIRAFNQHQILNCFANLYVSKDAVENDVVADYQSFRERRLLVRGNVNVAIPESERDGYSRYEVIDPKNLGQEREVLIHSRELRPVPSRWPSVLRWRVPGTVYANGTGAKYVREHQTLLARSAHPFWKERARK